MPSIPEPAKAGDRGQRCAVYQPIPIAWVLIVGAPLAIVVVAVLLGVRAVVVPGDSGFRTFSALWSVAALVAVGWLATHTVVRAELTDAVLRWRTLITRGEAPLSAIQAVRSGVMSRSVTMDVGDRRLTFRRGPAVADLVADLRHVAPHVDVHLAPAATHESILDPLVERHTQLERRSMYAYHRTG
jgi:hypothetical protein